MRLSPSISILSRVEPLQQVMQSVSVYLWAQLCSVFANIASDKVLSFSPSASKLVLGSVAQPLHFFAHTTTSAQFLVRQTKTIKLQKILHCTWPGTSEIQLLLRNGAFHFHVYAFNGNATLWPHNIHGIHNLGIYFHKHHTSLIWNIRYHIPVKNTRE